MSRQNASFVAPGSAEGEDCLRAMAEAIAVFSIDFRGLTALTDAGPKFHVFTPLIAALAGADEVLVLCHDNLSGLRRDILINLLEWGDQCGVLDRLTILEDRKDPRLSQADVITNLGAVRPIDEDLIYRLSPTAAIPLMWETSEWCSRDLDLNLARSRAIPVLGTSIYDKKLRTIDSLEASVLRALLNCGIKVVGSRLLVVGGGALASTCQDILVKLGACVSFVDSQRIDYATTATLSAADQDAIIVAEYQSSTVLVGETGLNLSWLLPSQRPSIIVRVAGRVDPQHCEAAHVTIYPRVGEAERYASVATDFVGPRLVIDLCAAGLAVGAHLSRQAAKGVRGIDAELSTLSVLSFAQGFSDRHIGV